MSVAAAITRTAVANLAGVPSIVFGLFGLGFFIQFVGRSMDKAMYGGELVWGQGNLLWAALTLALLTLPTVIVATEEALRTVPADLRAASIALGATFLGEVISARAALGALLTIGGVVGVVYVTSLARKTVATADEVAPEA
jgi:phosphate transport system permease protein